MDVIISKVNGLGCLEAPEDLVGKTVDIEVVPIVKKKVKVLVRDKLSLKYLSSGAGIRLRRNGNTGTYDFEQIVKTPI